MAPGSVEGCGKSSSDVFQSPTRATRSKSLYRLSYCGLCDVGTEFCKIQKNSTIHTVNFSLEVLNLIKIKYLCDSCQYIRTKLIL